MKTCKDQLFKMNNDFDIDMINIFIQNCAILTKLYLTRGLLLNRLCSNVSKICRDINVGHLVSDWFMSPIRHVSIFFNPIRPGVRMYN